MRNKNDSVKIEHLHHAFTFPLETFDVMHQEMTGEEAVITSGNDGKHMKGSKHYTNEAVDIRRWSYDEMDDSSKDAFWVDTRKIFPIGVFDVVVESDHFHVEFDPKPRKLTDEDLELREIIPPVGRGAWSEPNKPTELPKLPIWKRNGFKRVAGLVIGVVALIVKVVAPELGVVVDIVGWGGGALLGIGGADALKKNREKDSETYVDRNKYLRIIADIILRLLKQFFKQKGK